MLDGLKDVAEMCWKDDKNKRLTLPEICKCLTELSGRPRHSTVQSGVSQGVSTSDIEMVRQRSSDVMMDSETPGLVGLGTSRFALRGRTGHCGSIVTAVIQN